LISAARRRRALGRRHLKCQLKPVDRHDYAQFLTASQLAQLKAIFPQGVCDYNRPGVEQQLVEATWLTYPSPGEFDLTLESEIK
jgi:hypothetical protein